MLEEENKKKNSKTILTIIGIIITAIAFCLGGLVIGMNISNNKREQVKCKEEESTEEVEIIEKKDDISYKDKVVYGNYGDIFILYAIDNGDVYYKTSASRFAGLNVCPSEEDYCKTNPTYNNDMNKIEGITDVKRLKYVSDLGASDERFIVYAITENGDVYTISGSKVTKTNLENIEDLTYVSNINSYYEFSTKDGKTIKEQVNGSSTIDTQ